MICRYCGTEFEPKKRGRKNTGFCSKHCGDRWRYHNSPKLSPPRYRHVCACCGRPYLTDRKEQQYCSVSCASRATMQDFHTERTCPICGKGFTATTPQTVYCSEECTRRATRDREQRKRRKRRTITGDHRERRLSLDRVYREAEGVCSICGLPVPCSCERNDGWSRTRDHIIPITTGGAHTYGNCQLAHRICNSIKKQEGEGFRIDWESKYESDPEKWGPKLIRLDDLLHEDACASPSP